MKDYALFDLKNGLYATFHNHEGIPNTWNRTSSSNVDAFDFLKYYKRCMSSSNYGLPAELRVLVGIGKSGILDGKQMS